MAHEINKSSTPWTCFPDGLNTSEFIDISTIGSQWGKFLDPATGKTHDCEEYYEEVLKQMEDL